MQLMLNRCVSETRFKSKIWIIFFFKTSIESLDFKVKSLLLVGQNKKQVFKSLFSREYTHHWSLNYACKNECWDLRFTYQRQNEKYSSVERKTKQKTKATSIVCWYIVHWISVVICAFRYIIRVCSKHWCFALVFIVTCQTPLSAWSSNTLKNVLHTKTIQYHNFLHIYAYSLWFETLDFTMTTLQLRALF